MRYQRPHYLSNITGLDRPSNIVFFDTETSQTIFPNGDIEQTLRLGHAMFCRTRRGERLRKQKICTFYTIDEFWEFIESCTRDKITLYLVAHNTNFDLSILKAIRSLHSWMYELKGFYSKAAVGIYKWTRGKTKIVVLDNMNFFSGKLETWGDLLDLPKLPVDFSGEDEQLISYCIRDVEIMRQLWLNWFDFLDANKCGNFAWTVASTALTAFRHSFMSHKIWIHKEAEVLELERNSYKGGRVEVRYKGKLPDPPYYLLDINSMYPYVMQNNDYPNSLYRYHTGGTINQLYRYIQKYAIVADVTIDTPEPVFPHKVLKKVCYPIGRFRTTLTTPELAMCLFNGWLVELHSWAHYQKAPIFKEYVDHFYSLRMGYERQGNRPFSKICKLLLNSLYGKFGQWGIEEKYIGPCPIDEISIEPLSDTVNGREGDLIKVGGSVIERYKSGEHYNSSPIIASHVTAYARLLLYSMVKAAGNKNCFYMDTDSLLVSHSGLVNLTHLMHPTTLGMLKLEAKADYVEIFSPKDYVMDAMVKRKGVRQKALVICKDCGSHNQPELTHCWACTELLSRDRFVHMQWPKLQGMIRKGEIDHYIVKAQEKNLYRQVTSGHLQGEGWVTPFQLPLSPGDLAFLRRQRHAVRG